MVDPLSYISIQPVLHDWCNKSRGMYYPVWDGSYKRILDANRKDAAAFFSNYLNGLLPYARRHITVNRMC